jgi:uncharacterized beta-barrel protein YwiB (DUF1934 family)
MIFSESQKHHFLYETPFGAITMGINTHSIKKNLRDDGGHLEIRYDIQVDNIAVSSNLFEIDIKSFLHPHMGECALSVPQVAEGGSLYGYGYISPS